MNREINLFEEEVEVSTSLHKESLSSNVNVDKILEKLPPHSNKNLNTPEIERPSEKTKLHVKRLIEALLFASSEPLPLTKIREVTDQLTPLKPKILKDIILDIQSDYITQQRGFRLDEIAQGYLLRSCEEFSSYIELLYRNKRGEKLSQAAAEVLAIIAYKQPITRPQIESIRGVDSTGVVTSLLERGLIAVVGKLEAPGRPSLYGITNEFLAHFGLKGIEELANAIKNSPLDQKV